MPLIDLMNEPDGSEDQVNDGDEDASQEQHSAQDHRIEQESDEEQEQNTSDEEAEMDHHRSKGSTGRGLNDTAMPHEPETRVPTRASTTEPQKTSLTLTKSP